MGYIDKSALVAEIERLKYSLSPNFYEYDYDAAKVELLEKIEKFLDTLEVKEVDLDVMQRMEECPYRQVGCTMYESYILECKGACNWVVDYLKLKELKEQKGE